MPEFYQTSIGTRCATSSPAPCQASPLPVIAPVSWTAKSARSIALALRDAVPKIVVVPFINNKSVLCQPNTRRPFEYSHRDRDKLISFYAWIPEER